ncbi:phosphoribosyltransferase family protein [Sinomonas sp. ASV322]|uniref:phosphoribosyltransferase n=1 Tax=Sinomonas sp. ASV322 TaxID=3041920 RepID=UPI0027DC2BCB|nr:phosphoribosyltransferase family protein [Sinomonas sp. ASV322]MDQ4502119.1 phosphoribosyltransferase family protein [Sinomonas sp. ASV322]
MAWPYGDAEHGPYADRAAAGRVLAAELGDYAASPDAGAGGTTAPALVLGLSRGGVAVAAEVARVLSLPLDVVPARKLGIPGHEEVAFGAIAACDGVRRSDVDRPLMRRLLASGFTESGLDRVREREAAELERQERLYLAGRSQNVLGRIVVVCDDGAATGDTARAAIAAVRAAGASAVVLALPVAPPSVVRDLAALVDRVVCPRQPHGFRSVGGAYISFPQCSDEEVMGLLAARG